MISYQTEKRKATRERSREEGNPRSGQTIKSFSNDRVGGRKEKRKKRKKDFVGSD